MTQVEICNLSISHLGVSKEIAAITEDSSAAKALNRYYDLARRDVLRRYPWPFAVKFATLSQIGEDPTDEWGYSYRYPSACLKILRILSGERNDDLDSKVVYKIVSDDEGQLIYTDVDDAEIEYVADVTDTQNWPEDFVMAFSRRLAHLTGPRLGASPERIAEQAAWFRFELDNAAAQASNEEQPDPEPKSSFEQARD